MSNVVSVGLREVVSGRRSGMIRELGFTNQLRSQSSYLRDVSVSVALPSGDTREFTPANTEGFSLIGIDGSRPFAFSAGVPEVAARSAAEDDAAYRQRLLDIDGSDVSAQATSTATVPEERQETPARVTRDQLVADIGEVAPSPDPLDPFVPLTDETLEFEASVDTANMRDRRISETASRAITRQLPVIGISKTGPATGRPGERVSYEIGLQNDGSSSAQITSLTDRLEGAAARPVELSAPGLGVGQSTSAIADDQIPEDAVGALSDVAEVKWADDNRNQYGPLTAGFTTQVTSNLALQPTLESTRLKPDLQVEVGSDVAAADTGDAIAHSTTVRNAGGRLSLRGRLGIHNAHEEAATIGVLSATLQRLDAASGAWVAVAGAEQRVSGYVPLVPLGPVPPGVMSLRSIPTEGATHGPTGTTAAGSVVAAQGDAEFEVALSADLSPAEVTELLDPADTSDIRLSWHVETKNGAGLVGALTARTTVTDDVRGQDASARSASVGGDYAGAGHRVHDAQTHPELASLEQGEAVTIETPGLVSVPDARGATESDQDYLGRLGQLDSEGLRSSVTVTAVVTGATVRHADGSLSHSPDGNVTANDAAHIRQRLPVVSVAETGPTVTEPGQIATFEVTLHNSGSAPASLVSVLQQYDDRAGIAVAGAPATLAPDASFSLTATYDVPANRRGPLEAKASVLWTDASGNSFGPSSDDWTTTIYSSADLAAPPLDLTSIPSFQDQTSFIYTGPNAPQQGVAAGTISAKRMSVIRGFVRDRLDQPLAGVTVAVVDHPEFGESTTLPNGQFYIAVNGGSDVNLRLSKAGYFDADRRVETAWQEYAWAENVVLLQPDAAVSEIDLSSPLAPPQSALGSTVVDYRGTRTPAVFFPQGVQATMDLPDGSSQSLQDLHVRVTEATVGQNGPAAMPAPIPERSEYTWAANFTVDEAEAAGATAVRFTQPVIAYQENFLNAPVGVSVPVGTYAPDQIAWTPEPDGRVVEVLAETGGVASLDLDGSGQAASQATLDLWGISVAELEFLAARYEPGQELWRIPKTHFSWADWNFNWSFPVDAVAAVWGLLKDLAADPCSESGSIILCENRTLGEDIPLQGSSEALHYRSDRVRGRSDQWALDIPITDENPPSSVIGIEATVTVAGKTYQRSWDGSPANLRWKVKWDGRDAFGRRLQGAQKATVKIGYQYRVVYRGDTAPMGDSSWDDRPRGVSFTTPPPPPSICIDLDPATGQCRQFRMVRNDPRNPAATIYRTRTVPIGGWDASEAGLGGWTLSSQHVYDPVSRTLYEGNGNIRRADPVSRIITTIAGAGPWGGSTQDGVPAKIADVNQVTVIEAGPNGSIYTSSPYEDRIRRIDEDGTITTVVGTGVEGDSGDGGPATAARVTDVTSIALGPDGSLFFADQGVNKIRKVDAQTGIISTVKYLGSMFQASGRTSVAAAKDGTLFVTDRYNNRIARIDTNGRISTFYSSCSNPALVEVDPAGDVIFNCGGSLLRAPAGTNTVKFITAMSGGQGVSGIGGKATAANFPVQSLNLAPDGTIYLSGNVRVAHIDAEGYISVVAGGGTDTSDPTRGEGGPATAGQLNVAHGVAVTPSGDLFVADWALETIHKVGPRLPGFDGQSYAIASEDGREIYSFDSRGRHIETKSALTAANVRTFNYSAGELVEVVDGDGNATTITRDAGGTVQSIVGPFGHETDLEIEDGVLRAIVAPDGRREMFGYQPGGLLTSWTDPSGGTSRFVYDDDGRLTSDTNAAGDTKTLSETDSTFAHEVTITTGLGRTRRYKREQFPDDIVQRTKTDTAGHKSVRLIRTDGTRTASFADGTTATSADGPDPRFSMEAPVMKSLTFTTPGGRQLVASSTRQANRSNLADPLSLTSLVETTTVNGATSSTTYERTPGRVTQRSPLNRLTTTYVDPQLRPVRIEAPDVHPLTAQWNSHGQPTQIQQGTRTSSYGYDVKGRLATATDPLARTTSFAYDAGDRVTSQTYPDGRSVSFDYDTNGNLTSLTPPARPSHTFGYDIVDRPTESAPPELDADAGSTRFSYDADGQLSSVTRPGGTTLGIGYDGAGRPSSLTHPDGAVGYGYHPTTGQLVSLQDSRGVNMTVTQDGPLPTAMTWAGPISGSVAWTWNNNLQPASSSVNGAHTVAYGYDADGLLTSAGAETLTRNAASGRITATTTGGVATSHTYDAYGDPAGTAATHAGASLYSATYTRDDAGRITSRTETIDGESTTYAYTYDAAARLKEVTRGGLPVERYSYDANGNRTSASIAGQSETGRYDDQDRLVSYTGRSYRYSANGQLRRIDAPSGVTELSYDALGALTRTLLPDGREIEYLIDGAGRRVGKRIDDQLVGGLLYDGPRVIAELNADGSVRSRFVYASRGNVPDYMVQAGVNYRLISDHLGSVRLVVNTATGQIAQRLDYDSYGRVLQDTNRGLQPFGYAGGLTDPDTGLVRFGARDYDPTTGRWTAKDPIGFNAGDPNLYAYVANDPVNWIDPKGLYIESAIDVGFILNDINQLIRGCGSLTALGGDTLGLALPFVAGIGTGAKHLSELPPDAKLFRGPNAPERVYPLLADKHKIPEDVASNRLHKIKEDNQLGAADDVVLGPTGDVWDAQSGDFLDTLTNPGLGRER